MRTPEVKASGETGALTGCSSWAGIEFCGPPGCGKTTVARALLSSLPPTWVLRESLFQARGRWSRRFSYLSSPFIYASMTSSLFRLAWQADSKEWTTMRRFCNTFLLHKHVLDRAVADRDQRVIYDQGFLQIVWSMIYGTSPNGRQLPLVREIIRAVYSKNPMRIIFFECPAGMAAERLACRTHGRSRFDTLAPEDAEEEISRSTWIFDLIKDAWMEEGGKVLTLNSEASVEENVERIRALLFLDSTGPLSSPTAC